MFCFAGTEIPPFFAAASVGSTFLSHSRSNSNANQALPRSKHSAVRVRESTSLELKNPTELICLKNLRWLRIQYLATTHCPNPKTPEAATHNRLRVWQSPVFERVELNGSWKAWAANLYTRRQAPQGRRNLTEWAYASQIQMSPAD